ncbi:hypothetical protein [uncultured Clostridium sp.]|jgi:hypothetical protein|uniref:hypothetical protein n=1 Tax=uncultured Clostridium sp. TaxID=59620 RepID=UPI002628EB34|nr:hypothetical protein [uncultured Clostridium sp.]
MKKTFFKWIPNILAGAIGAFIFPSTQFTLSHKIIFLVICIICINVGEFKIKKQRRVIKIR